MVNGGLDVMKDLLQEPVSSYFGQAVMKKDSGL
jgi:hypothetical protein